MSNATANVVTVSIPLLEQFRYFLAHQPPFLTLVLAYFVVCLTMFWMTRGIGYLVSFFAGFCYLVPYVIHGYTG